MACVDTRQLTQAQRAAGFDQLRNAGVVQAVRPFSGKPTAENLADYINRELFPAVKRTREKVNDVYRPVTDNAPSANPLAYYFSDETGAADPTAGRLRLDNATQDTATTIRISQSNGRLKDVAAWLDVMAGSATAPLGTLTLFHATDPGRFIRFDLNTMVDQGAYWDLGVTPIESSHDNPFLDSEGIVISFIPGVAGAGATVPPGSISPVAANTIIGNPTASSAAPQAISVGANTVLGRVAGNIVAAQLVNAQITDATIASAKLRNSAALSVIGRSANTSGVPGDIAATGARQFLGTNAAGTSISFQSLSTLFPGAPIYDVMAAPFNAVGDGTTDDTAAINAAIAAANASPGVVYLGYRHRISAALTTITGNNITIQGRGRFNGGTAFVVVAAVAPDAFIDIQAQYSGVQDFWFACDGPVYTTGTAVRFGGALQGFARRLLFTNVPMAIEVFSAVLTKISDISVINVYGTRGISVHGDPGTAHATWISNSVFSNEFPLSVVGAIAPWQAATAYVAGNTVLLNGNVYQAAVGGTSGGTGPSGIPGTTVATSRTTTTTDGTVQWVYAMTENDWVVHDSHAHTVRIVDCAFLQGGCAIRMVDTSGGASVPEFLRCVNCEIDHVISTGISLDGGQQAEFEQTFVTSMYAGRAIEVNSGFSGGWRFDGGYLFASPVEMVSIEAGDGIMSGMIIGGGGLGASNTYDVVAVAAGVQRFAINSCSMGRIPGGTSPSTRYGLSIGAGCDNYTVVGNRFIGNLTGAVLNTPGLALTRVVHNNVPDTTVSIPDGDYGDITVSSSGSVWNIDADVVTNVELANMAENRIKGRAISAGTGDPQDLTGAEAGGIIRLSTGTTGFGGFVAAGTYNDAALAAEVKIVDVAPTPPGDVILTGFALAGGNGGGYFVLGHFGSGRVILRHQNTGSLSQNRISTPNGVDFVMAGDGDTVVLVYMFTRWQVAVRAPVASDVTDGDKGDITVSSSGATWTVDNDVVSDAKLRNSGALSVIGRSANSSGDPADISASAASAAVLRESGSALGFGTVATAGIADDAVTNAKLANMAGATIKGRTLTGGTGDPVDLTGAEVGQVIRYATDVESTTSGTLPAGTVASTTTTLRFLLSSADATYQGLAFTGPATPEAGKGLLLYNRRDSTFNVNLEHENGSATLAAYRLVTPNNLRFVLRPGDAVFIRYAFDRWIVGARGSVTDRDYGDVTVTAGGATWTVDSAAITDAKLRNSAALSVIGRASNTSGVPADITANSGTDADCPLRVNAAGTALTYATLNGPGITNSAVTLAKMADLAQSRIIGRAEGAGTGAPTALTPAEVTAIIDNTPITWSSAQTFNDRVHLTSIHTATGSAFDNVSIGNANIFRLGATANPTPLTGMVAAAAGHTCFIVNTSSVNPVQVFPLHSNSSAANQFAVTGTSYDITPLGGAGFWYDGLAALWRPIGR